MSQIRAAEAFTDALLEDDPVALYDRAPCGYLSTDPDGTITKANSTFLTLIGYAAGEVLGRRLVDLLTPGGRLFLETRYAPLLRLQGSVRELALDLVGRDGTRIPVLLNATAEHDELGRPRVVRIAVFDASERRRFERDLLRATEAAQQAQREAEAARAAAEEAERHSRAMVETLQGTLVPRTLPEVDGLELAGVYRPAGDGREVGGDFYDAFVVDDDECWLVLGDVSGKGVDAAVVTALVRNGARTLALSTPRVQREPSEVLRRLDQLLDHHETTRFCTAAVLRLRRAAPGWSVTYASGGHPPLVLRSGREPARFVEASGQVLGALPIGEFDQLEVSLGPGDSVLLYTDGVTESRHGKELYGDARLLAAVDAAGPGAAAVTTAVIEDVMRFGGGLPRDDIACLAVTAR
jgi:sigma-B regulation protein RsbU (phosphoserine phosphatase)